MIFQHINSNCRGLISAKDTKGRCSRYCYMQTSSCPEQKREPCYFMFFRINVAIVVRTNVFSVFINQTSLSFEFKRLKLGQLFAISLSRRFSVIFKFITVKYKMIFVFHFPPRRTLTFSIWQESTLVSTSLNFQLMTGNTQLCKVSPLLKTEKQMRIYFF